MTNGTEAGERAVLEYYDGAYGPTLRCATWHPATLLSIRDLCLKLSRREVIELSIRTLPFVELVNLADVRMRVLARRLKYQPRVLREGTSGNLVFDWCDEAYGWDTTAALIDGLYEGGAGHQYLTEEGRDNVLVELTFME